MRINQEQEKLLGGLNHLIMLSSQGHDDRERESINNLRGKTHHLNHSGIGCPKRRKPESAAGRLVALY